jgi:hypothetical protein
MFPQDLAHKVCLENSSSARAGGSKGSRISFTQTPSTGTWSDLLSFVQEESLRASDVTFMM